MSQHAATEKVITFMHDMRTALQILYDEIDNTAQQSPDLDFTFLKKEILDALT